MIEQEFLNKFDTFMEEIEGRLKEKGKKIEDLSMEEMSLHIFSFAKNLAECIQDRGPDGSSFNSERGSIYNPHIPPRRVFQICCFCYVLWKKFFSPAEEKTPQAEEWD